MTRLKVPFGKIAVGLILIAVSACGSPEVALTWSTDTLQIELDTKGRLVRVLDPAGRNRLVAPAALLTIHQGERRLEPTGVTVLENGVDLAYEDGIIAQVRVRSETTHIVFELAALTSADSFDVVVWGPYVTDMGEVIGETVGVVQADDFALGIQALNARTLGGYPERQNDTMPQETKRLETQTGWGDDELRFRVEAARPVGAGSSLQAYVRNRSKQRIFAHRGYSQMIIPALEDEGLVGSAIAVFGVPREKALETIGLIEVAEGLPHPMLDGEWVKTARSARGAYIVLEYDEKRLDQAVEATRRAGLRYLYHEEPFSTWGQFTLDPQYFPEGEESLKRMVVRAEERGVMLGLHTLSNFVTPNDPFVTPVPSTSLVTVGASRLSDALSPLATLVPIEDTTYVVNRRRSHLQAARIENELIRFDSVSAGPPWQLVNVLRGAFGTTAAAHPAGTEVFKMDDHAYRVFLADMDLSLSMAERLAVLMRESGVRQIGFDGLGGVQASGHGKYAENLFVSKWWENLGEELRNHSINSASGTTHWYWHVYSRMNWGEPWRGGFREAQLVRRLRQQDYYRRNFMHPMLGWFKMTPETSLEDVEWMLARAAGFDAGYSFVTIYETLDENGLTGPILDQMRVWENARLAGAFPEALRLEMQDISREYQLEEVSDSTWVLFPLATTIVDAPEEGGVGFEVGEEEELLSITLRAGPRGIGPTTFLINDIPLTPRVAARPGTILRIGTDGNLNSMTPTWQSRGSTAVLDIPELELPGTKRLSWQDGGAAPVRIEVRYRKKGVPLEAGAAN
jgi:hypothetical protein